MGLRLGKEFGTNHAIGGFFGRKPLARNLVVFPTDRNSRINTQTLGSQESFSAFADWELVPAPLPFATSLERTTKSTCS